MSDELKSNAEVKSFSKGKKTLYAAAMVFYAAFSILLSYFIVEVRGSPHLDGLTVFGVIFLVFTLWSTIAFGRGVFLPASEQKGSDKAGMQLGPLPVIGTAFLILFLSKAGSCQSCAYNSDVKSNLQNIYLACKAYWADYGGDKNCNADQYNRTTYGYMQSMDVSVSGSGTEPTFTVKGHHANGTKTFTINSIGAITEVDGK